MTDPQRGGSGQDERYQYGYSGNSDPAFANQPPYTPTQKLPPYEYGNDAYTDPYASPYSTGSYSQPYGTAPEEPPPPSPPTRRWLWILAIISVLTVLGLIIAVVVIDSTSQQTVVAPAPSVRPTEPSSPTTTTRTPTTTSRPRTTAAPPPASTSPSESETPGAPAPTDPTGETETVVYDVGGTGRAISITYVDTGGILQTEFNVMLPWSRQVELVDADRTASVNIVNFGREVTCTITVGDDEVESETSAGFTFCGAFG